jgi:hypothetical protein
MERRIEYRDLRDTGKMLPRRPKRLQSVWIMQRSENAQFLNLPLDLFVYDHRLVKPVPAVHDPMADGIDLRPADLLEDGLERRPHAGHALGLSFSQYPLGICFDRFRRDFEQIEFE